MIISDSIQDLARRINEKPSYIKNIIYYYADNQYYDVRMLLGNGTMIKLKELEKTVVLL